MYFLHLTADRLEHVAKALESEALGDSLCAVLTPEGKAEYAAAGATSKEIGDALGLSHHTVKTHLRNVYDRLGKVDKRVPKQH